MNRAPRIVLVLYCLCVLYCCLWVPWFVEMGAVGRLPTHLRVGYGWLWVGPQASPYPAASTSPDLCLIVLRLVAATAIGGAAFFLVGLRKSATLS